MEVNSIVVSGKSIMFSTPSRQQISRNKVDVLTGENGSGKTATLLALAEVLGLGLKRPNVEVDLWPSSKPDKVIAQTFSPFSRFPREKRGSISLSDMYGEGLAVERGYVTIGIDRSARMSGPAVSRKVVEQALFRLSENLEQARSMGKTLDFLGFRPELTLRYRQIDFLSYIRQLTLRQLEELLARIREGDRSVRVSVPAAVRRALSEETDRSELKSVVEILAEAVRLVEPRKSSFVEINVGFQGQRRSGEYAELQAIIALRRLEFLKLKECVLTRKDGPHITLTEASSGQQQLLCSIFGLAGAISSNSLVLIDEPELSLHPKWQLEFLDFLKGSLASVDGCHVIVATHSPLVVQRARDLGLGIVVLSGAEGSTSQSKPLFQKGSKASVEEALLDVFSIPLTGSTYLSSELFGLVTTAETKVGTKVAALQRIEELAAIYREQPRAEKERALIENARSLISDVKQ